MTKVTKLLATLFVAVVCVANAAGCGSDCSDGCERLDECVGVGVFGYDSVDQCANECEDAIDDGRASESRVGKCADCLDSNACSEILGGDCNVACSDLQGPR